MSLAQGELQASCLVILVKKRFVSCETLHKIFVFVVILSGAGDSLSQMLSPGPGKTCSRGARGCRVTSPPHLTPPQPPRLPGAKTGAVLVTRLAGGEALGLLPCQPLGTLGREAGKPGSCPCVPARPPAQQPLPACSAGRGSAVGYQSGYFHNGCLRLGGRGGG